MTTQEPLPHWLRSLNSKTSQHKKRETKNEFLCSYKSTPKKRCPSKSLPRPRQGQKCQETLAYCKQAPGRKKTLVRSDGTCECCCGKNHGRYVDRCLDTDPDS